MGSYKKEINNCKSYNNLREEKGKRAQNKMDKMLKKAPKIRQFAVNSPIVFAPNVQVTHLKSWSDQYGYYRPVMTALLEQTKARKVIFMPNIVSPVVSIEERGK